MKLCSDNMATISIGYNLILHDRTNRIEVDQHFIKGKIDNKLICTSFMSTGKQ